VMFMKMIIKEKALSKGPSFGVYLKKIEGLVSASSSSS